MFTIRKAQIEAMAEPLRKQFERELLERLRNAYPEREKKLGGEAFARIVRKGIARANQHGVSLDGDVGDLVELFVLHGLGFEDLAEKRRDEALALLTDPNLGGTMKATLLRAELMDAKRGRKG